MTMTTTESSPTCAVEDGVSRFVLLFEGRSGSTYLIEALASHPGILAEKECFAILVKNIEDKDGTTPEDQVRWAREFYSTERCAGYGAVGFKTKWKDILRPDDFRDFLRERGMRVIVLQRRNRIKLLVSLFRAVRLEEETGEWNLYDERRRQAPIKIDLTEFDKYLGESEARHLEMRDYVATLDVPLLELSYEDILDDDQATFDRVCRFLEVPARPLAGKTRKHTSDDLRDAVANFDELKARFVGTRYESMFDEVTARASKPVVEAHRTPAPTRDAS
jgi:LPS sulfotransferase NodH